MNKTKEEWLFTQGTSHRYMISSLGRVKSVGRVQVDSLGRKKPIFESILVTPINQSGYPMVRIRFDSEGTKTCSVHRLVAIAFIPNPQNKAQVNHINCDRKDPRAINLEWVTPQENTAYMVKVGNSLHGEKNFSAKLDWAKVLTIETVVRAKTHSQRKIARHYGVSHEAVGQIMRRQTWKRV